VEEVAEEEVQRRRLRPVLAEGQRARGALGLRYFEQGT
jgi:hypothetical protein